jgi:restriction system protein
MAEPGRSTRLDRVLDDYIEDVAVGTPWWVLVLAFGLGLPLVAAAAALLFHVHYPTGSWGVFIFLGVLMGGGLRLVARERERSRAAALGRSGDLAALRDASWQDFEIVVGELIRRHGYTVKERGGFHADGGIDLIAEGRAGRIVVQCKQWRSWSVSLPQVKELYATVKADRFREGWLVTCGRFTDPARAWVKGKEIRLIDGSQLVQLYGGEGLLELTRVEPTSAPAELPSSLECPECGQPLRRQTNKDDRTTFWGCSGYPACRFTAEDPPTNPETAVCQRGHPMVLRKSKRGVAFWGCSTYPQCHRKRLFTQPSVPNS